MLVLTITTPSLPCKNQYPSAYKSHLNNFPSFPPSERKGFPISPPPHPTTVLFCTHLLAINTPIIRLDDNEALAGDVQAGALDLLDVAGVLVRGDDFLHFGG